MKTQNGSLSPPIAEISLPSIIEALPSAVYVTDAEGIVTYFNAAAVELTGYVPELGTARWCVSWKMYGLDDTPLPHEKCPMAIALKEGRPARNVEILIEQPGGHRLRVATYPSPIFDDQGRLVGGINMLVDVTERRRLGEAKARLSAIVETSDDAIVSKTLDGAVRSWNKGAERIFGYSSDEVIGRPITIIIPPELHSEEYVILDKLRRGEQIDHYETERIRKDGTRIHVSLTVSPIRNEDGVITGASKIARDITERKQTEELLREANQRKDEFIAILAHELRNPLAPLQNALSITRLVDDPQQCSYALEVMGRQVDRITRLVDDLMDVSRLAQGRLRLRKEPVELELIMSRALDDVRNMADSSGHRLVVDVPEEPLYVDGDPIRLGQILLNLLSNAVKYTPKGGSIHVQAERVEGQLRISVRDDGVGIPVEELENVFEMFRQIGHTSDEGSGGLGIGLSLVKSLVELHGGSVAARSAGIGKGSEFIVWLPLQLGHGLSSTARSGVQLSRNDTAVGNRVLVVDDNGDTTETLKMLLEMSGHNVRTAADGHAALEAASEFKPELVLLDIGLPGMNGCEVARCIRAEDWGKQAVLAAVTGWGNAADRKRTREAGFDYHLVKPLTSEQLKQLLDELRH